MKVIQKPESTYESGHCVQGNHEGTRNLSKGGTLFPSCAGEYVFRFTTIFCTCWCHEMFKVARKAKEDTVAEAFALSDPISSMHFGNASASDTHATVTQHPMPPGSTVNAPTRTVFWEKVLEHEDLAPLVYRMVSYHVFGIKLGKIDLAVNTARRTRGSLDINVEAICKLKLEGFIPQELTPVNIGILIDPMSPPSAGAIHAVLHRWKNAGYCELSEKPLELKSFTARVGATGITGAKKITAREKEARAKGFF